MELAVFNLLNISVACVVGSYFVVSGKPFDPAVAIDFANQIIVSDEFKELKEKLEEKKNEGNAHI